MHTHRRSASHTNAQHTHTHEVWAVRARTQTFHANCQSVALCDRSVCASLSQQKKIIIIIREAKKNEKEKTKSKKNRRHTNGSLIGHQFDSFQVGRQTDRQQLLVKLDVDSYFFEIVFLSFSASVVV